MQSGGGAGGDGGGAGGGGGRAAPPDPPLPRRATSRAQVDALLALVRTLDDRLEALELALPGVRLLADQARARERFPPSSSREKNVPSL